MAAKFALVDSDLCCPVCCDIFRDPVLLHCSHSFCRACVLDYWGTSRTARRDCPLCRREFSLQEEPVPNLILKNLCESFLEEEKDTGTAEELCQGPLCQEHGEPLKLFCVEDKEPICVVCYSSRRHKRHECRPVAEAALEWKEELQTLREDLQEKRATFNTVKDTCEKAALHIQNQVQCTEKLIRAEFQKLRAFLDAEEEARIVALKEEGEKKSQRMNKKLQEMKRTISALSDAIRVIEEQLKAEDVTLLHDYKRTVDRTWCSTEEPELFFGSLVKVATHLGSLKFQVWKKMLEIVQNNPIVLDPNTAAPWLILSDDLTSVREGEEKQSLPNIPERFDLDAAVLGAEVFYSGMHCWEVEVGDSPAWVVGVAKKSVQRKEKMASVLKNGYLTIFFYQNMYFAGSSPLTRLILKKKLERLRVHIDCDRNRVSFFNAGDDTHIFTFKHTLTEGVFPYLWVGCKQFPLRIQPVTMAVLPAQPGST